MNVREAIAYLQKCPEDSELIILDPTLEDCPIEGLVRFTQEGLIGIIPGGSALGDEADLLEDEEIAREDLEAELESEGVLPGPVSACTALVPWGDACVADLSSKPVVDVVRPRGRVRSA